MVFVAGPNGEMDWMQWNWDDKLKQYVNDLTDSTDTILLGRKLAEGFIPYWTDVVTKKNDPQYEFAKKMVNNLKLFFQKHCLKINGTIQHLQKMKARLRSLKTKMGKTLLFMAVQTLFLL